MIKRFVVSGMMGAFLCASTASAQVPTDVQALIDARSAAMDLCFDQKFESVRPACDKRGVLTEQIEQAGWCYRWPMKDESDGKFVDCQTTAFENIYIDIDPNFGKPSLTDYFAKWKLELFDKGMTGKNPVENTSIGSLSIACSKNSEPKAVILLNDTTSGFTGEGLMLNCELGSKISL